MRLLDDATLLAGAASVDLNPLRAALAETREASDHTSAPRRIEAERAQAGAASEAGERRSRTAGAATREERRATASMAPDRFLSPPGLDERGADRRRFAQPPSAAPFPSDRAGPRAIPGGPIADRGRFTPLGLS